MLICQPPLLTIQAYTSCCAGPRFWRHRHGDDRPPASILTSTTGITVGDILDATAELQAKHRLCPDASPFNHHADGTVDVHVSFEAVVKAEEGDPFYVRERRRMVKEKEKKRERIERQGRIDAYAAAKRTARDEGRAIPTLAEFEAAAAAAAAALAAESLALHDGSFEQIALA
ncbi:hypothetical protein LTR15_011902 [Elasticomyces elasticus]|nr:hypothetical protein LTR15_011902 [Elasticomyces elasticus]